MAREFALSVVAPDKSVVEEGVTSVIAPGEEGYFGVLAGHAPLIASLKPGLVEYVEPSGVRHYVYVGGGFAEVSQTGVTILADEAARAGDIDLSRAEQELDNARRALRGDDSTVGSETAVQDVERAVQRIRAARIGR
ncbi:MAG TPA: ATP synthase F1 subunit epsilon [Fimbriimonas sp.]|nr:ATP synthase F1 subunit epsilon [Fimbriimonas sp.]